MCRCHLEMGQARAPRCLAGVLVAPRHVPAVLCSGIGPAAPGGRAAGAAGPLLSPEGCACLWVTLCFLGEEKYRRKVTFRWGNQCSAALVKKCLGGGISGAAPSARWSFRWWWWKWPRCCSVAQREVVTSSPSLNNSAGYRRSLFLRLFKCLLLGCVFF